MKQIMEIIDRIIAANIEITPVWNQEYQYIFDKTVSVLCDRQDVALIRTHVWYGLKSSDGTTLYMITGPEQHPVHIPMANCLLGLNPDIYVSFKNGNHLDMRRQNLVKG